MITKEEFFCALEIINEFKLQLKKQYKDVDAELTSDSTFNGSVSAILNNIIYRCGICEKVGVDFQDLKISHLSQLSISEFSKVRGVGPVVIKELQDLCSYTEVVLLP